MTLIATPIRNRTSSLSSFSVMVPVVIHILAISSLFSMTMMTFTEALRPQAKSLSFESSLSYRPRLGITPKHFSSSTMKMGMEKLPSSTQNSIATTSVAKQWNVDLYQSSHNFVWEYGSSLIDILDPQPHERILDVGCGSGELTFRISARQQQQQQQKTSDIGIDHSGTVAAATNGGGFVIGMDQDYNMIERCKKQMNDIPMKDGLDSSRSIFRSNIDFFQGDVRDFLIPKSLLTDMFVDDRDGENKSRIQNDIVDDDDDHDHDDTILFDAIFSNAALHWVNDTPRAAIESMTRHLKPGGRFVVEFGGKGNIDSIIQSTNHVLGLSSRTTSASINNSPWYFPSIAEYTKLLEEYGHIETTYATLFERPTTLHGTDGMKNWLRMFGSVLLDQSMKPTNNTGTDDKDNDHDGERAIDRIVDYMRPTYFDGTNWTADYRRIRIVGRKKMT